MNHLDTWKAETHQDKEEREWIRWSLCVENGLGHSLDGDGEKDGYSMDEAYDLFQEGWSVVDTVRYFRNKSSLTVKTTSLILSV